MRARPAWQRRRQRLTGFVLLLAVVVLVAFALDLRDWRLDLSEGRRHSLSPTTVSLLQQLDEPVELVAFYPSVPAVREPLRELVDQMSEHARGLSLRFVDPAREPGVARAAEISVARTVLLNAGALQTRVVDPGEAELMEALRQLLSEERKRVLFVEGTGGASITDGGDGGLARLAEELTRQNYRVDGLLLGPQATLPDSVDLLVLAAPERALAPDEAQLLQQYLLGGGSLLAFVEPLGSASVDSLLAGFGVVPGEGFVVDPSDERRNLGGMGSFRVALARPAPVDHAITRGLDWFALLPLARPVDTAQPPPPGISATRLLVSSEEAWSEMDWSTLGAGVPQFEQGVDRQGPFPLAIAATVDLARYRPGWEDEEQMVAAVRDAVPAGREGYGRLLVVGDVDFVGNANLQVQGNRELFLRMLGWLSEGREALAEARPLDRAGPLVLSRQQASLLRWGGVVALPALPLLVAVALWWRRRQWA